MDGRDGAVCVCMGATRINGFIIYNRPMVAISISASCIIACSAPNGIIEGVRAESIGME